LKAHPDLPEGKAINAQGPLKESSLLFLFLKEFLLIPSEKAI
jgi:hypothetical protein